MKQDILNLKDNLQDQGWLDRSYRKHNIIVYGLNEDKRKSLGLVLETTRFV